jgi:hypothetical protein
MTTPLLLTFMTTLAQADPAAPAVVKPDLAEVSKHVSSDGLIPIHWLLIAAGGIIVLLCGLSIANWWKHRGEHSHPLLVFSTTAQLVGLSYRNQWTLLRLAHQQSLTSPLTLMLSPDTFDHHAKTYLDSRPGWRQEPVRRQLSTIRATLFDDLPQRPAPQPASA